MTPLFRKIASVIVLIVCSRDISAQEKTTVTSSHIDSVFSRVRLGVFGGASLAKFHGTAVPHTVGASGLVIGASIALDYRGPFVFAFEPGYARKVAGVSALGSDIRIALDYIDAPFLLRYEPGARGTSRMRLFTGFVVSTRTRCAIYEDGRGLDVSSHCDSEALHGNGPLFVKFNRFTAGSMFGATILLQRGRIATTINAHYEVGLTRVSDQDGPRHQLLAATIGLERRTSARLINRKPSSAK